MKICIYGAALDEIPENYRTGAEDFGRALAKRGHSLLFGGGKHGCMGAVAGAWPLRAARCLPSRRIF